MNTNDPVVKAARQLAQEVHEGQARKGSKTPYFEGHLEPVALLVRDAGGSAEQIAAAYLHDAVEDGGGEPMLLRIQDEVGPEVAAIVRDLSDSLVDTSSGAPKEDWSVRKTRYLDTLGEKPSESLEVSLAVKVHNAESILADYDEIGEALWSRFNKTEAEYHLWYYRRLLDAFRAGLPDHPLTEQLARTIEALEARVAVAVPDIFERVAEVQASLSPGSGPLGSDVVPTWEEPELRVGGDDARTEHRDVVERADRFPAAIGIRSAIDLEKGHGIHRLPHASRVSNCARSAGAASAA